jgi:two-component system, LuxR family, response regulator FixJ
MEGTVFLVDDNDAFRQSTQWLLSSYGLRVEEFRDGTSFLTRYAAAAPGARERECLLLDVRMPGMTGIQVQDELLARQSDVPIIFITAHGDVPLAVQAMRRGAVDFLEKPFSDQALIDAIGSALAREDERLVRDREVGGVRANLQSLTPRERQVLDLVVEGALNKTVADKLGISVKTVELHRSRVMEKMRAQSLAQLIQMVMQARG